MITVPIDKTSLGPVAKTASSPRWTVRGIPGIETMTRESSFGPGDPVAISERGGQMALGYRPEQRMELDLSSRPRSSSRQLVSLGISVTFIPDLLVGAQLTERIKWTAAFPDQPGAKTAVLAKRQMAWSEGSMTRSRTVT